MSRRTRASSPSTRRPIAPVTITRLPAVTCQQCGRSLAVRPFETASEVLTEHYATEHAGAANQPGAAL